ncbi:unnamed protein product [Closterium sp. NIES-54]
MAVQADEGEDEEMAFCFFTPLPGEPATVEEALSKPQKKEWKAAMDAEFNSLIENGTWELVELPEGRRPISSKWVFKVKSGADGALERFKSRLVAKGFQQKEKVDFGEIFAPVVKPVTLRTVLAGAAVKGWHVREVELLGERRLAGSGEPIELFEGSGCGSASSGQDVGPYGYRAVSSSGGGTTCWSPDHSASSYYRRLDDLHSERFVPHAITPHWPSGLPQHTAAPVESHLPGPGPFLAARVETCVSSLCTCVVSNPGASRGLCVGAPATTSLAPAFVACSGATSQTAQLSFTLDPGASSCFFRDCTDLTPLRTPVTVALADPSVGPVVARNTTTLPCPAAPSRFLIGYYTPLTPPAGCSTTRSPRSSSLLKTSRSTSLSDTTRVALTECVARHSAVIPPTVSSPYSVVAEGEDTGAAGASGVGPGGAGVVGVEVTPMEDTAASSQSPRPTSPPGLPSVPQFPPRSSLQPVAAEPGGVPGGGTGGLEGVSGGGAGSGVAGARGSGTVAPTPCNLRRPVYGLWQAPRECLVTLRSTLAALDFFSSSADPSLFVRRGSTPFFVLVYVDDLVFATRDRRALASVKEELQRRHTCTDLGALQHYLGLQITRDRAARTITLTQSHMVEQILMRFCFLFSKVQLTPLAVDHGLTAPPSDESFESRGPYRELVGCLMYLMTCTRQDLAYPLSVLARFIAPGRHRPSHWYAAKRVAKYVASTSGMGLVLGGKQPVTLTGFSDSSWADNAETRRSTQGYSFSLGTGAVLWRSTRASSLSSSSCEGEVYAAAMAAQELHWLTFLPTDLGERPCSPPVLFVDNRSAVLLCEEPLLGPAPLGVSQVDPPPLVEPLEISYDSSGPAEGGDLAGDDMAATRCSLRLETPPGFPPRPSSPPLQPVAVDTGAAEGGDTRGEDAGGASPGGADTGGAKTGGTGSGGAETGGAASPSGGGVMGAPAAGPSRSDAGAWSYLDAGGAAAGGTPGGAAGDGAGGAGGTTKGSAGAGGSRGAGAACSGGARTRGAGAAGAGGAGAGGAGGAIRGTGGTGDAGAANGTGTALSRPFFYPQLQSSPPPPDSALRQVFSLPSSTGLTPPLLCPPTDQSQLQLLHGSLLLAPTPHTEVTKSLTKHREPETRASTPVRACRVACPRPPAVSGTHVMTLRPSSVPHRVPLPSPHASSLPDGPDPESDLARAASPTLVDFAARLRFDYVVSLVTTSESVCPPSLAGEPSLGSDVLEDRQFELDCLAAALPRFASMLLGLEGEPDAPNIPTPRSYAKAIAGE